MLFSGTMMPKSCLIRISVHDTGLPNLLLGWCDGRMPWWSTTLTGISLLLVPTTWEPGRVYRLCRWPVITRWLLQHGCSRTIVEVNILIMLSDAWLLVFWPWCLILVLSKILRCGLWVMATSLLMTTSVSAGRHLVEVMQIKRIWAPFRRISRQWLWQQRSSSVPNGWWPRLGFR